jgi:hypothetical protein
MGVSMQCCVCLSPRRSANAPRVHGSPPVHTRLADEIEAKLAGLSTSASPAAVFPSAPPPQASSGAPPVALPVAAPVAAAPPAAQAPVHYTPMPPPAPYAGQQPGGMPPQPAYPPQQSVLTRDLAPLVCKALGGRGRAHAPCACAVHVCHRERCGCRWDTLGRQYQPPPPAPQQYPPQPMHYPPPPPQQQQQPYGQQPYPPQPYPQQSVGRPPSHPASKYPRAPVSCHSRTPLEPTPTECCRRAPTWLVAAQNARMIPWHYLSEPCSREAMRLRPSGIRSSRQASPARRT